MFLLPHLQLRGAQLHELQGRAAVLKVLLQGEDLVVLVRHRRLAQLPLLLESRVQLALAGTLQAELVLRQMVVALVLLHHALQLRHLPLHLRPQIRELLLLLLHQPLVVLDGRALLVPVGFRRLQRLALLFEVTL